MYRAEFFLVIFFLICLSGSLQLSGQENYEIRKITFRGNKTLDKSVLLGAMVLKEVSFPEKKIFKKEPSLYNGELVKLEVERLARMYQSEGFLDVRVEVSLNRVNNKKQTVELLFDVQEGEPVLVGSVALQVTGAISFDADSLLRSLSQKPELAEYRRFRDKALLNDLQYIEDALRNRGYAYAKVEYKLDLKPELWRTGIVYSISPGPVCHLGETSISDNKYVSEKLIRKQIKYQTGELYNRSQLTETRQNLYQLQLFRVVSVAPQTDVRTQKTPVPVIITVEEAPRVSTRWGVGYGTEDQFRSFLDLDYRGFLGGARRVNLYLKHSALEPYSASLRWIQPHFLVKNGAIAIHPFISKNVEPGYETRTFGLNIPFTYTFNSRFSSGLTYYLEDVAQRVEAGDREFEDMESSKFLYNKSGVLLNAVYNSANPKFSPTDGEMFSLGFKLNGHLFGSDFNYTRLWADFRSYQKLGNQVLAVRLMGGGIHSTDDSGFIPVEDRFYSGGSNSVRGWNRSGLGPQRESGTPLGGKTIAEANLEMRCPLFWRLDGVAFLDAGNVWHGPYRFRFNKLAYAAGAGIRIGTPIGPIRFDVGFPLWNEKKSPQFFISVGQAF